MDASRCGHCLIINNVEFEPKTDLSYREGSNVDCAKLEKRFKSLNFIVAVKTNLKSKVSLPQPAFTAHFMYLYPLFVHNQSFVDTYINL